MEDEDPATQAEGGLGELVLAPPNFWTIPGGIFSHLSPDYRTNNDVRSEYIREFWKAQTREVKEGAVSLKTPLPPKCIRRIIKHDEDVIHSQQRISKEVVALFGKAAELFISELSLLAWMNVQPQKKVVQERDIATAVHAFHIYDFLIGVIPRPKPLPKRVRKRHTPTSKQDAAAPSSQAPAIPTNGGHLDQMDLQEAEEYDETNGISATPPIPADAHFEDNLTPGMPPRTHPSPRTLELPLTPYNGHVPHGTRQGRQGLRSRQGET